MQKKLQYLIVLHLFFVSIMNAQHTGEAFFENLSDLPYLYQDIRAIYLTSYDRSGGNDDGFHGTYSEIYRDENGEHVIFDEEGSGCVYGVYFTHPANFTLGRLKFYFHNEKALRIDVDADSFFARRYAPFIYPLVYDRYISSGGFSSVVPISFSQGLKITTERKPGFYGIYYHLIKGRKITSYQKKSDFKNLIDLFQKCGADPKQNAEVDSVYETVVDLEGANVGEIRHVFSYQAEGVVQFIRLNPLFTPDAFALNHTNLKITFDDDTSTTFSVPIGSFFGSGLGETEVRSLFVGMSPSGSYYCYFPMPFQNSLKIELENMKYNASDYPKTIEQYYFEIGISTKFLKNRTDAEIGYFGASYSHAYPATGGDDYRLFDYTGRGAVLGHVVTIEPVHDDVKKWWEGDLRMWIDGETEPSFHGTGHEEDLSQGGWSSFWLMNPFTLPLFGEPKTTGHRMIDGQTNASTTTYRFYPGTIPFSTSMKISIEHGTKNNRAANYSSVVYYYYDPVQTK
ncbi:DUF2961 domain-containing protein [candidate division KSB1 bacterium]|nr:DUF2961 domain-containing protein [candidate division KSB1 bacterium]